MKRLIVLVAIVALVISAAAVVLADPIHIGGGRSFTDSSPIHIGGGRSFAIDSPIHIGGGR